MTRSVSCDAFDVLALINKKYAETLEKGSQTHSELQRSCQALDANEKRLLSEIIQSAIGTLGLSYLSAT